jgi:hypothetical protein
MRLPGTLDERLHVMLPDRWELLGETDTARLEDEGIRVDCWLAGTTACVRLRLMPTDVQFLRGAKCADFALLLARGDDVFEAHVVELKGSVDEKDWARIQGQHEWATVRLLAIAGVLDIRIRGVTVYTAFRGDRLSREGSPNPAAMKIPLDATTEAKDRKRVEARRSWESGRIRMEVFQEVVEHLRIRTNDDGFANVGCRSRSSPSEGETMWFFEPIASVPGMLPA